MRAFAISLLILLLSITSTSAQDTPSTIVYLHEPVLGELFRVDADGNMTAYSLGVEDTQFTQVSNIAINDAGTQAAYCMTNYRPADSERAQATFIVRDIMAETNLVSVDLGDTASCETGEYNEDQSQITIAHVIYETFFPEQELDPERPSWRLLVMDTSTGEIVHALNGNQDNAPSITFMDREAEQILARTVAFTEGRVYFKAYPYLPTHVSVDNAYIWDITSGEIQPYPALGTGMTDFLPETEELIFGAQSDTLPMPQVMGIGPAYNAIRYQQGIDSTPVTLFESAEETVNSIDFVFDGERILAGLTNTSDMENIQSRWVMLDREGVITGEFDAPEMVRTVIDGAGGLIVLHEEQVPMRFPTSILSYYDGETLTEFWRYEFPEEQESWAGLSLVWASNE